MLSDQSELNGAQNLLFNLSKQPICFNAFVGGSSANAAALRASWCQYDTVVRSVVVFV